MIRMPVCRALTGALTIAFALLAFMIDARAVPVERVVSKGGIEAWLVSDPTLPLIAMSFAFEGGAAQDAPAKAGTTYFAAQMLDEGAGDLDARAFRDALDRNAIELDFRAGRDELRGGLRTLTSNREEATRLLRLALTAPRFDAEPLERVRGRILASLRQQSTSPTSVATRDFWRAAYPDHPYGHPTDGTLESVPAITRDDLKEFTGSTLARSNLKIAVVGDIDAKTLGVMLDEAFGGLPAKPELKPVADAAPNQLGKRIDVTLAVPQAVIVFGGPGIARNDPEFMAAYLVNHITGGGTFSSRLYNEVREKRGLAYSVDSNLIWLDHSALFAGMTATRADRVGDTLEVIEAQIKRMAESGPTQKELDEAKSYLKGSQMLSLDTSTKLAAQLVQYQLDDLGIDYIDRRNALIDAVTLDDARRVARRMFGQGLLVTLVGPTGADASGGAPAKAEPRKPQQ